MELTSPSTISAIDLINFSKDIAQLNLGYLGISVAVLAALGGVFYYFNIRPLKETLEKQEKMIQELKQKAQDLLALSAEQSDDKLENFKVDQSESLNLAFEQQEEKLRLEMINKIQEIESRLSDRIEEVSESKDAKLREIILFEAGSYSDKLEKELTSKITAMKEDMINEASLSAATFITLKAAIKVLDEKVKELQVYKYSKEGQMGAIIFSIDLLKYSIDDYLSLKEKSPDSDPTIFGWKVEYRLNELMREIGATALDNKYIVKIDEQLIRLVDETYFTALINQLKKKLEI